MSDCEVKWNILSLDEWQDKFNKIRRSNLLQSFEYGVASCKINHQSAKWGVIYIDGVEAGMIQILEAGILKNMIHGIVVDRGPIWFDGFGDINHAESFIKEINRQFPKRWGRKRRFIPEFEYSDEILRIFAKYNIKKNRSIQSYQTIWLDLTKNKEELRSGLKGKWRNSLKKAEGYDMKMEWDDSGATLPFLLEKYIEDKKEKNYSNISPRLLMEMAINLSPKKNLVIGTVIKDKKLIASCLIIIHGASATYQIGWISNKARNHNANNFALWQAMLYLKSRGIKDFDLGGINDETATNIKKFKEGMGGNSVKLCGFYS